MPPTSVQNLAGHSLARRGRRKKHTDGSGEVSTIPLTTVVPVSVEHLFLDSRNPRLVSIPREASEVEIISHLYRSEDLSELLQSISANGYLDIEPMIVHEEESRLVVLEGNRRLAAIRLFREPELCRRITALKNFSITIPNISKKHLQTLDRVSVYRVANREDSRSFIGFKHINGAARWESYAKAKFAADWYAEGAVSLSEIANRIGDKHSTVKRMVNAIYVLEQAESEGVFSLDDRFYPKFNFSHLYTALSRTQFMRYLGLEVAWSTFEPSPAPIQSDKVNRMSEVLTWIYGSQQFEIEPIIRYQNPDIKRLAEVLADQEAVAVLKATGSLSEAHSSTQSAEQTFSEALLLTRKNIRVAANSLRGFDHRATSIIGVAEEISETAQMIVDRMRTRVRTYGVDKE